MKDKVAFGRGIRMLRLARGLPQEAFSAVSSLTYVGVLERGIKSTSIEKACELASVLGVHPLTLFVAMFVERDSLSVRELMLTLMQDFQDVACQLPGTVGDDPRNRERSLREVQAWLKACLSGLASRDDYGLRQSTEVDEGLKTLEEQFEGAVVRFQESIESVTLAMPGELDLPAARRKRATKTYRNPHTGEVVVAKSKKNGRLKAWSDQYGWHAVALWVVDVGSGSS